MKILNSLYLTLFCWQVLATNQMPEFLLGSWQINGKTSYEQWHKMSDSQYQGEVIEIVGGRKVSKENLSLEIQNGVIIYRAQVLNQNNGKTIEFIGEVTDGGFKVTNPDHDFPQTIEYTKISENSIQTRVTGKGSEGFTQQLLKKDLPNTIPEWFFQDLAANVGTWITDNSNYQSTTEPHDSYAVEWQWGIGNTSITGRLYSIKDGKESGEFWQFRQYWDNLNNQAVIQQFGNHSVIGTGTMQYVKPGKTETIQTFSMADGTSWKVKHVNLLQDNVLTTTSYSLDKEQQWQENRTYQWHKQKSNATASSLGNYSISLAVKDLHKSVVFYQKLGFSAVEGLGGLEKNWVILNNGQQKIGLFKGMFPENTITFNPLDARYVYQKLKDQSIPAQVIFGMDKPSGPASFSVNDPDGNPILIDQHKKLN